MSAEDGTELARVPNGFSSLFEVMTARLSLRGQANQPGPRHFWSADFCLPERKMVMARWA
jgi:hypothetical protein